jgi:hypothetical protein
MHVAEFPQCSAGFERKAAFSQIRCWEQFLDLPDPELLADAELSNDRLIALGIVSFEVVQ